MSRKNKDLQSVTSKLAGLAHNLPTQKPAVAAAPLAAVPSEPAKVKPAATAEEEVQLGFYVRKSLRKELAQLAAAADHPTLRSFVLAALKDKGLSVTDADLVDRRSRRS